MLNLMFFTKLEEIEQNLIRKTYLSTKIFENKLKSNIEKRVANKKIDRNSA
jgi:hypothetical protein